MRKFVAKLERDLRSAGRLLVPQHNDWQFTGHVLRQIGIKHGFELVGKSRLTNDCLIAMTARRLGLTVITKNFKDFELISEFRKFNLEQF